MTEAVEAAGLSRLHERARDFLRAISESNHLPEGFPVDEMLQVAQVLSELDATDGTEDRQVLAHAQAKLRGTRTTLHSADENTSSFELERAHNALFAEIDALLQGLPERELVSLRPPRGQPALVVPRIDIEDKVVALEQRILDVRPAASESMVYIDQSRHVHFTFLSIRDLRIKLEGLVKIGASLRAELKASLIDLDWVSHLTGHTAALSRTLGDAVAALKKAREEGSELVRSIERVRRLSERVVNGGRTLLKLVRRLVARRGRAPSCPDQVSSGEHTLRSGPKSAPFRATDLAVALARKLLETEESGLESSRKHSELGRLLPDCGEQVLEEALFELQDLGLLVIQGSLASTISYFRLRYDIYVAFDRYNTIADARRLAELLLKDEKRAHIRKLFDDVRQLFKDDWPKRRFNPALGYLLRFFPEGRVSKRLQMEFPTISLVITSEERSRLKSFIAGRNPGSAPSR